MSKGGKEIRRKLSASQEIIEPVKTMKQPEPASNANEDAAKQLATMMVVEAKSAFQKKTLAAKEKRQPRAAANTVATKSSVTAEKGLVAKKATEEKNKGNPATGAKPTVCDENIASRRKPLPEEKTDNEECGQKMPTIEEGVITCKQCNKEVFYNYMCNVCGQNIHWWCSTENQDLGQRAHYTCKKCDMKSNEEKSGLYNDLKNKTEIEQLRQERDRFSELNLALANKTAAKAMSTKEAKKGKAKAAKSPKNKKKTTDNKEGEKNDVNDDDSDNDGIDYTKKKNWKVKYFISHFKDKNVKNGCPWKLKTRWKGFKDSSNYTDEPFASAYKYWPEQLKAYIKNEPSVEQLLKEWKIV